MIIIYILKSNISQLARFVNNIASITRWCTLKIYEVGRNRPRCNKINCLPNITLPIFRCQSTARKTLSIYFVSLGQPNYFYCTCNVCSTEGRLKIGLKSTMHDWLIPGNDTHIHTHPIPDVKESGILFGACALGYNSEYFMYRLNRSSGFSTHKTKKQKP